MAKIFGIINLSQDSFSGDGVSDINKIKEYIEKIAQFGLYGIDVGAMSTKPNGDFVSEFDELKRLEILPQIIDFAKSLNVAVSLDSFRPSVIEFGLKNGIDYINDVTGFCDEKIIDLALKYSCVKCIVMHSLEAPVGLKIVDPAVDICDFMINWANKKIEKLVNKGVDKNRIIIDIGLGFGKNIEQCWQLLRDFDKLKQQIDAKIYVGHSRKSFLKIVANDIPERDIATLLISKNLIDLNCDYLRIHNINLINIYKLTINNIVNF